MKNSNMIFIELPPEIAPNSNLLCLTDGTFLMQSLSCSINSQIISIKIATRSGVTVAAKTKIDIKLSSIMNPGSSKMTGEV